MSNYINAILHSYMETAMIVMETFMNMYDEKENNKLILDFDVIYNETDLDTYDTLYGIALKIEDENQRGGGDYTTEDIKEKAREEILKEYGYKEVKTYTVIETEVGKRTGFADRAKVIGQFNNRREAEDLVDKENMERRWIIEQ